MFSLKNNLFDIIHKLLEKESFSIKNIQKAQDNLTKCYNEHQNSQSLKSYQDIIAYILGRMPATYAAMQAVLKKLPTDYMPESFLDIGAGPGTATLAALNQFDQLNKVTLIERHPIMLEMGKTIFQNLYEQNDAEYITQDIQHLRIDNTYDLVILSYVIGELEPKILLKLLEESWQHTKDYLIIVGPGTPYDYDLLMKARAWLVEHKATIAFPCPHHNICPLLGTKDWCHFSVRLQRTKMHQQVKQGSLSYEDEKYSYLIASKKNVIKKSVPIITKPIARSGHVIFDLCGNNRIKREIISKKDKPLYKKALKKNGEMSG